MPVPRHFQNGAPLRSTKGTRREAGASNSLARRSKGRTMEMANSIFVQNQPLSRFVIYPQRIWKSPTLERTRLIGILRAGKISQQQRRSSVLPSNIDLFSPVLYLSPSQFPFAYLYLQVLLYKNKIFFACNPPFVAYSMHRPGNPVRYGTRC